MTQKDKYNLKEIFEELETIAQWFESEDIDLHVGLKKYEQGMLLIKEAQKQLKNVENKIKRIK